MRTTDEALASRQAARLILWWSGENADKSKTPEGLSLHWLCSCLWRRRISLTGLLIVARYGYDKPAVYLPDSRASSVSRLPPGIIFFTKADSQEYHPIIVMALAASTSGQSIKGYLAAPL